MSDNKSMKRYRYIGEPGQMPVLGGGVTINMVDDGIYEADRPLPSTKFQEITDGQAREPSKKSSRKKTESAAADPDENLNGTEE